MPSQEGLKETTDPQSMWTLLLEWPFPHLYIRDNKICHVPALSSERRWHEGQGINDRPRRNTLICEPFGCGMDRVKKGLIQFCTKCFQVGHWKCWWSQMEKLKNPPANKGRKKLSGVLSAERRRQRLRLERLCPAACAWPKLCPTATEWPLPVTALPACGF